MVPERARERDFPKKTRSLSRSGAICPLPPALFLEIGKFPFRLVSGRPGPPWSVQNLPRGNYGKTEKKSKTCVFQGFRENRRKSTIFVRELTKNSRKPRTIWKVLESLGERRKKHEKPAKPGKPGKTPDKSGKKPRKASKKPGNPGKILTAGKQEAEDRDASTDSIYTNSRSTAPGGCYW